jgi:hypothetical protein
MYHVVKEIWQWEASVGKNVCGFWFEPPHIEHLGENEVNF